MLLGATWQSKTARTLDAAATPHNAVTVSIISIDTVGAKDTASPAPCLRTMPFADFIGIAALVIVLGMGGCCNLLGMRRCTVCSLSGEDFSHVRSDMPMIGILGKKLTG